MVVYRALLRVHVALLGVYRALLGVYIGFLFEFTTWSATTPHSTRLFWVHVYRSLLDVEALLSVCRALLGVQGSFGRMQGSFGCT